MVDVDLLLSLSGQMQQLEKEVARMKAIIHKDYANLPTVRNIHHYFMYMKLILGSGICKT